MPSDPRAPRDWDAAGYDSLPMPHVGWGERTLARLPLSGDETVLELGCGAGRDTEALLARVPTGRVIALDGSAAMVEHTRKRCGGPDGSAGGRLEMLQADLRAPLALEEASVDAVFSVATLHWVPDHPAVFAELARVLRPGARVALDYGGPGNVAEVTAALVDLGRDYDEVAFPSREQELAALTEAGFVDLDVTVRAEEPFHLGGHLPRFLETICLGRQLAGLSEPERRELVAAVAERLPDDAIRYVRTEVTARRR